MKLGLNLLLWATHVVPAHDPILEQIKSAGYDGVEVPIFGGTDADYQTLRRRLDSLELQCSVVSICTSEHNPISPDPAIRRAAVERLNQIVEHAAILEADVVCGPMYQPLGEFSGSGPTEEELQHAVAVHREVGDLASRFGITLALEPLNRFECYFLNTAAAAADYVRRVNHPNVRAMFDSFHANIEEENLVNAYAANAGSIAHIHVSNNDRGVPGRGHINFGELFRAYQEAGYDGWLTIEAFGRALPDLVTPTRVWRDFFADPSMVVQEGISFLRRTLKQTAVSH